jgi:protein-S-isoprenylcysteine O-methyltransferase Ste14
MPLDPPRQLVITGLYCRVRNPMYLGMGLLLIGEAFLLPQVTREMLIMTAVLFVVVNVFVMVYEEPVLRSTFGDDYERYKREVGRWVPTWRGFSNPRPEGGSQGGSEDPPHV